MYTDYMDVRAHLIEISETEYKNFSQKLVPGCENMLGIRIPQIRQIAKKITKGDWRKYLGEVEEEYFEETMISGLIIGYAEMDINERIRYLDRYIPKITNWSLNDTFCATYKAAAKYQSEVWEYLISRINEDDEYVQRVIAIMIMDYYLNDNYIDKSLDILCRLRNENYYAKMGVAWAVATAYAKYPDRTIRLLQENRLSKWTHNKAIAKIKDSYRVPKENKILVSKYIIR